MFVAQKRIPLKEIEKPAGIKNPARLKDCRAAILPTGSVMPSRYGVPVNWQREKGYACAKRLAKTS